MEADCTREAIDMYNNAGKWEEAHRVSNALIVRTTQRSFVRIDVCVQCLSHWTVVACPYFFRLQTKSIILESASSELNKVHCANG